MHYPETKVDLPLPTTITPERIEQVIVGEDYYVYPNTTLTVCCLTLENGYNVTGESACVDPANFDKEKGREIARKNAKQKIWALEGYALCGKLMTGRIYPGRVSTALLQHQRRVVEEQKELLIKIDKLKVFLNGTIFPALYPDEMDRLSRQCDAMMVYFNILQERIDAF